MLLVLSAPSKLDTYYKRYFKQMIDFYVVYANAIINAKKDYVIVMADKTTMPLLEANIPHENLLLVEEQLDPWIRDVSPVCPGKNIQFKFSGGLKRSEAKRLQKSFNRILEKYNIMFTKTEFVNDGGNMVFNEQNNVLITTDKFLELNKMEKKKAIQVLKDIFHIEKVSIIPADDDKLGHVDGMCSLVGENTILLVDYADDAKFKRSVIKELQNLEADIYELNCPFSEQKAPGGFASAYGIYVNCVITENVVYVPTFDNSLDEQALSLIKANACGKEVISINVNNVCELGGSLRCLSWEVEGDNAKKLIQASKISNPL